MIEIEVKVLRTSLGFAWVERSDFPLCTACLSQAQCQSIAFSRLFCRKNTVFQVRDPIGVKVGDRVTIGLEERVLLKGAIKIYGIPLLLLLAGAMSGKYIGLEYGAILGGVSGLSLAILGLRWRKTSLNHLPAVISSDTKGLISS